ncbi:hypothetical protein D3C79_956670 [compost metagenome]
MVATCPEKKKVATSVETTIPANAPGTFGKNFGVINIVTKHRTAVRILYIFVVPSCFMIS